MMENLSDGVCKFVALNGRDDVTSSSGSRHHQVICHASGNQSVKLENPGTGIPTSQAGIHGSLDGKVEFNGTGRKECGGDGVCESGIQGQPDMETEHTIQVVPHETVKTAGPQSNDGGTCSEPQIVKASGISVERDTMVHTSTVARSKQMVRIKQEVLSEDELDTVPMDVSNVEGCVKVENGAETISLKAAAVSGGGEPVVTHHSCSSKTENSASTSSASGSMQSSDQIPEAKRCRLEECASCTPQQGGRRKMVRDSKGRFISKTRVRRRCTCNKDKGKQNSDVAKLTNGIIAEVGMTANVCHENANANGESRINQSDPTVQDTQNILENKIQSLCRDDVEMVTLENQEKGPSNRTTDPDVVTKTEVEFDQENTNQNNGCGAMHSVASDKQSTQKANEKINDRLCASEELIGNEKEAELLINKTPTVPKKDIRIKVEVDEDIANGNIERVGICSVSSDEQQIHRDTNTEKVLDRFNTSKETIKPQDRAEMSTYKTPAASEKVIKVKKEVDQENASGHKERIAICTVASDKQQTRKPAEKVSNLPNTTKEKIRPGDNAELPTNKAPAVATRDVRVKVEVDEENTNGKDVRGVICSLASNEQQTRKASEKVKNLHSSSEEKITFEDKAEILTKTPAPSKKASEDEVDQESSDDNWDAGLSDAIDEWCSQKTSGNQTQHLNKTSEEAVTLDIHATEPTNASFGDRPGTSGRPGPDVTPDHRDAGLLDGINERRNQKTSGNPTQHLHQTSEKTVRLDRRAAELMNASLGAGPAVSRRAEVTIIDKVNGRESPTGCEVKCSLQRDAKGNLLMVMTYPSETDGKRQGGRRQKTFNDKIQDLHRANKETRKRGKEIAKLIGKNPNAKANTNMKSRSNQSSTDSSPGSDTSLSDADYEEVECNVSVPDTNVSDEQQSDRLESSEREPTKQNDISVSRNSQDQVKHKHFETKAIPVENKPKRFPCMYCDKVCESKRELRKHVSQDHCGSENVKCSRCARLNGPLTLQQLDEIVLGIEELRDRIVDEDTLVNTNTQLTSQYYQCVACSERFGVRYHYAKHKQTHGNVLCPSCCANFASVSALAKHVSVHNNGPLACRTCKQTFFTSLELFQHLKAHIGKIQCHKCDTSFMYEASLMQHVKQMHFWE